MSGDRHLDDVLSAYLDNELAPAAHREAEAHLATCASCRAELDEVDSARWAVRSLPVRPVPARWQAGSAGVNPDYVGGPAGPTEVPAPTRLRPPRPLRRAAWAAAAVAAAMVAFFLPHEHRVDPELTQLVDSHVARASVDGDPLSTLAPIAVPVSFGR